MIEPAVPPGELERQVALDELSILYTPPEERFDRLVRIARNALNVPFAFVNLVDADQQWCKSGAPTGEEITPRSISFCAHAILEKDLLVISDTWQDRRFVTNPLVTGGPKFRFYAGIPLLSVEGHRVGAFCVLDRKPREFSSTELALLGDLAAAAQEELTNSGMNKSLEIARLAQQNAERAVKSRKDFLAVVSHEIRTPMNGIVGMTEILSDSVLTAQQRDALDTIRECAGTLLSLINDVLDFSKIESGKMAVESISFDPRASISHVLALHAKAASAKNISLESEIDPAVPALVTGDPLRVKQVLLNLVGNALKFTSSGSVRVRLGLRETSLGFPSILKFSVEDTGIGISPEAQERLFQPFSQADSSISRQFGGTGLGLMICKQLVELMGGEITLKSTVRRGSTFSFTIAVPVDKTQLSPASSRSDLPTVSISLPRESLNILVVEDNLTNQRVVTHLLKRLGQSAEYVRSGLDCLQRLQEKSFDLILMDLQMPEIDGLETVRRIRLQPVFAQRPWIVAVTADALTEDREKCFAIGMNDHLSKPLTEESLKAALVHFFALNPKVGSTHS
jgi:signal transduction histidine kinase/CheY-like chemotaxis protein